MIKPSYCTRPAVESCRDCSLTSYNRDCQNKHGGYRENSGRKPSPDPRKARSIKFTDAEWETLKQKADSLGKTISDYIRDRSLD